MAKNKVFILLLVLVSGAFLIGFTTTKPKVFVIGDSISIQYGPYLKEALQGYFEYDRKRGLEHALKDLDNPVGANGGDSKMVLEYLQKLADSTGFHTDYLLVNCGLHDIKTDPKNKEIQIPLHEYKHNLEQIVALSKRMKVKMVWVNTTPVIDSIHNKGMGFHRFAKDLHDYNNTAKAVMRAHQIPEIDLFTFTKKFGAKGFKDHVHYHYEIREKQADFIAGFLSHYLADQTE